MSFLALNSEQILYLSFAGAIIALVVFALRPSTYAVAAFGACLTVAAWKYVEYARPQLARPPMKEEAATYLRLLNKEKREKAELASRFEQTESSLKIAERELKAARTDQVRFAEALTAFDLHFPNTQTAGTPLHLRIKSAAEALSEKLAGKEQRLSDALNRSAQLAKANDRLKVEIATLRDRTSIFDSALHQARRQAWRREIAQRKQVFLWLSALSRARSSTNGNVGNVDVNADRDIISVTNKFKLDLGNPFQWPAPSECQLPIGGEFDDVTIDQRRLPHNFGEAKGYKVPLRKQDGSLLTFGGIPPALDAADEEMVWSLRALATRLTLLSKSCSVKAVVAKGAANLNPVTSKRLSALYQYASVIPRYAEDLAAGALRETTPVPLPPGNLSNAILADVRAAYLIERMKAILPTGGMHFAIIAAEAASGSSRQPDILIFVTK